MACQVLVQFHIKKDCVEKLRSWMRTILPDTRAFDGCITLHIVQDQEDSTNFVIIEQWETRSHYEKYLQWRTDTGTLAELAGMLDGDPSFKFFDYFGV